MINIKAFILISAISAFLFGCQPENPIKRALKSNSDEISVVMTNFDGHEIQILFSEINQETKDSISFRDYSFQVNDSNYFYPASSVKFPVAVLALEKLSTMPLVKRDTEYLIEGDTIRSTISKDIINIFAVSDNQAYNRLFEFLGKDYINQKLNSKGIAARISHRLSVENSADLNYKPIRFYREDSLVLSVKKNSSKAIIPLKLNRTEKGIGYTKNESLIEQPMDFSKKNYLPVKSLHGIMKRVIFPELFGKKQQFNLIKEDREFLLKSMSILPKEAGYTDEDYYDSYVKFLVFGDRKTDIPDHIKIYNKVGYAYGYLTDCAYVVNQKTEQSYIITATVHVNENQIYNDGVYEYESVGIPFMAELGRTLINYK